jgi:hypothetical protein
MCYVEFGELLAVLHADSTGYVALERWWESAGPAFQCWRQFFVAYDDEDVAREPGGQPFAPEEGAGAEDWGLFNEFLDFGGRGAEVEDDG